MKTCKHRGPRAPAHLSPTSRKWWAGVLESFVIEDHQIQTVTAAAESWDLKERARLILAKDGLTVNCRDGKKTHPCVAVERDARLAYLRAVRELALDVGGPEENLGGLRPYGRAGHDD